MTTYTVQAFAVEWDINGDPISFDLVDVSAALLGGQTTFSYSITTSIPNELPVVETSGFWSPRVDGTLLPDGTFDEAIGFVTSPSGTHNIYVIEDSISGKDYIIFLGGDPLPTITNLSEFEAFVATLTGEGEITSGPFAPGENISVPGIPGVTSSENDDIVGTPGNDTIDTGIGDDTITGLGGNDVLTGGDGNDTLYGGAAGDTLYGGAGSDSLAGGAGDDLILPGTNASTGTSFDRIVTGGGNDTVDFAAADALSYYDVHYRFLSDGITVNWGPTSGTVVTSVGTDTFLNLDAVDATGGGFGFYGSLGNDTISIDLADAGLLVNIRGGAGVDSITGGNGFDRLDYVGAAAGVSVNIGTGTTSNDGDGASDTFANIDEVRGSTHNDVLIGSGGNDRFITREGNDSVDGGGGFDLVRYDRGGVAAVDVDLGAGTASGTWNGQAFTDTLTSIEHVRGSSGNDTLTGSIGVERLEGRAGDDSIAGNAGADTLLGQDGNDSVNGGGGNDVVGGGNGADRLFGAGGNDTVTGGDGIDSLFGGSGNDVLNVVETGAQAVDIINGGVGLDTVSYASAAAGVTVNLANTAQNAGAAAGETYVDVENVTGSSAGGNTLTGDGGANVLTGGDGVLADALFGGAGNDWLYGGGANDALIGGDGADRFFGGDGVNDLMITGDDGAVDSFFGGAGIADVVSYFSSGTGVTVNLANQAANAGAAAGETFTGVEGIRGAGAAGNTLIGDAGGNVLVGGSAADSIASGAGSDIIYGGAGNDVMNAGDSIDIIRGDQGDDMLTGGAGGDIFKMTGADGNDTITDFAVLSDKVEFQVAGVTGFGDLVFQDLGGGDSKVTAGSVSVTFLGVALADIQQAGNFEFI